MVDFRAQFAKDAVVPCNLTTSLGGESNAPNSGTHFTVLDGLRGVAAIVIVAFHASEWLGSLSPKLGYLAVDLFFVLSGFVIAHSYEGKLQKGLSASDFFAVRFVRLFPLYILGVLIHISAILIGALLHQKTSESVINSIYLNILMLPSPDNLKFDGSLYPLNPPAWSLFFELVINMIYASTFRYWSIRNTFISVVIFGLLLICSWPYGEGGADWSSVLPGLYRVCFSFPLGVLLYLCHGRLANWKEIHPAIPFLLMATPFFLTEFLGFFLGTFVMFPAAVFLGARSSDRMRIVRGAAWVGGVSYAIYAVHSPILGICIHVVDFFKLSASPMLMGIAFVILIVPMAATIEKYYDLPVRKYWKIFLADSRLTRFR